MSTVEYLGRQAENIKGKKWGGSTDYFRSRSSLSLEHIGTLFVKLIQHTHAQSYEFGILYCAEVACGLRKKKHASMFE